MEAFSTSLLPMNPRNTVAISSSPYQRSTIGAVGPGFGANPWRTGFKGACGCNPVSGCNCGTGFSGFHQGTTLDQVAVDWFNRIYGAVTGTPPAGSTVPVPGSPGYYSGSIPSWVPWVILGYVAYKIIK